MHGRVEVFTIRDIGVQIAIRIVVTEIEFEIAIEISRILTSHFLHHDGHKEQKVNVGDCSVAIKVGMTFLNQAKAFIGVRIGVVTDHGRAHSHARQGIQTICQTDFVLGEARPANVIIAIQCLTISVSYALVLGDESCNDHLGKQ